METSFGHCKDCEFWESPKPGEDFGTCDGGIPCDDDTSLAYFVDYETYAAFLRTRADFGCALFVIQS